MWVILTQESIEKMQQYFFTPNNQNGLIHEKISLKS